jgi:hypothetical protein
MRNHGITVHRGRKDYATLPSPPEPQSELEAEKRTEIEEFLYHEINTHLIPNTILFVPGDETQPPTRTDDTEKPTMASYNIFAAIGLAHQLKMTAIWAINTNNDDPTTYEVTDLRTRAGRDKEKIKDGSDKAKRTTAAHQAHITGTLTGTNYMSPNPETTDTLTPIFTLTDSMWNETSEGTKGKGPSNNFDPMATSEFRTLPQKHSTDCHDRYTKHIGGR